MTDEQTRQPMSYAQSDEITELAAAMSKAQAEMSPAEKNGTNPHFQSKYAYLEDVWDACRKPLTDNGLSLMQFPSSQDGKPVLISLLTHSSGQWIRSAFPLSPVQNTPHAMGGAITYARRQTVGAITSVCPDEDDDGNAASAGNQSNGTARKANFDTSKAKGASMTVPEKKGALISARAFYHDIAVKDADDDTKKKWATESLTAIGCKKSDLSKVTADEWQRALEWAWAENGKKPSEGPTLAEQLESQIEGDA